MKFFYGFRKLSKLSILIILLAFCVIVLNEVFIYEWCYFKWNINYNDKITFNDDDLRILFVADPQLIGIEYEKRLFADVIRWDSDQFLSHGFSKALKYCDPNVVVFLGDIFDEGEIASNSQFQVYLDRFQYIFTSRLSKSTKAIIIPGDNDVGGEGGKAKLDLLLERFSKVFKFQFPYVEAVRNVNFIATDALYRNDFVKLNIFLNSQSNVMSSKLNIILTHNSINFVKEDLIKLGISGIISAHTHLSSYEICKSCVSSYDVQRFNLENYTDLQFKLGGQPGLLEITVPTCSYRMGVPYTGYGFLNVQPDGQASYVVLWLPYRFMCLKLYLFTFIVVLLLFMFRRLRLL